MSTSILRFFTISVATKVPVTIAMQKFMKALLCCLAVALSIAANVPATAHPSACQVQCVSEAMTYAIQNLPIGSLAGQQMPYDDVYIPAEATDPKERAILQKANEMKRQCLKRCGEN